MQTIKEAGAGPTPQVAGSNVNWPWPCLANQDEKVSLRPPGVPETRQERCSESRFLTN